MERTAGRRVLELFVIFKITVWYRRSIAFQLYTRNDAWILLGKREIARLILVMPSRRLLTGDRVRDRVPLSLSASVWPVTR